MSVRAPNEESSSVALGAAGGVRIALLDERGAARRQAEPQRDPRHDKLVAEPHAAELVAQYEHFAVLQRPPLDRCHILAQVLVESAGGRVGLRALLGVQAVGAKRRGCKSCGVGVEHGAGPSELRGV